VSAEEGFVAARTGYWLPTRKRNDCLSWLRPTTLLQVASPWSWTSSLHRSIRLASVSPFNHTHTLTSQRLDRRRRSEEYRGDTHSGQRRQGGSRLHASGISVSNRTHTPLVVWWCICTVWQMEQSFKNQMAFGAMKSDKESDEIKRVLLEGNPVLLGVTMVVSLLHTLFDMLAFKNGAKNSALLRPQKSRSAFPRLSPPVLTASTVPPPCTRASGSPLSASPGASTFRRSLCQADRAL